MGSFTMIAIMFIMVWTSGYRWWFRVESQRQNSRHNISPVERSTFQIGFSITAIQHNNGLIMHHIAPTVYIQTMHFFPTIRGWWSANITLWVEMGRVYLVYTLCVYIYIYIYIHMYIYCIHILNTYIYIHILYIYILHILYTYTIYIYYIQYIYYIHILYTYIIYISYIYIYIYILCTYIIYIYYIHI